MDNIQNQRQILANDDVSKDPFDKLPSELLLNIFKKVPQRELNTLAEICRRFNLIITKDKSLWQKVRIVGNCRVTVHLGKLMMRPVEILILFNQQISSPSIGPAFEATQSNWCVKEVFFQGVQTCPDDLIRIFNQCKGLKKIYLDHICVNDDVFVAVSNNRLLEMLYLCHVEGITPLGLEVILQNTRKLQDFFIDAFIPVNPNWSLIRETICENLPPSLLNINFSHPFGSITDEDIANMVRNCPRLECLRIGSGVALTGRSLESLRELKHLRELSMRMCIGISPEAFLALTAEMEHLVELDIWNGLRDAEELRHIEQLFGVNVIEDNFSSRVGTFKTRRGLVTLKY